MAEPVAVRVVVSGRVQGVWFRDACRTEAARLGVTGSVRNREDGTVELVAEGPERAVAALVSWARMGPPRAEVTGVSVEPIPPRGTTPFLIR
jgi:acylphosphatase